MDFVARGNFLMQSGTLRIDVAFWEKKVNFAGHLTDRWYEPNDLELAGKLRPSTSLVLYLPLFYRDTNTKRIHV
jgi:hypothetical protein